MIESAVKDRGKLNWLRIGGHLWWPSIVATMADVPVHLRTKLWQDKSRKPGARLLLPLAIVSGPGKRWIECGMGTASVIAIRNSRQGQAFQGCIAGVQARSRNAGVSIPKAHMEAARSGSKTCMQQGGISYQSANRHQARVLVVCCRRTTNAEGRGEDGAADLN